MIVPIFTLTARFALLTLLVTAAVTGAVSGVARAAQRPLPPLLYASNSRLYLFETNCADWLAICAGRDQMLLENLNQGFPVAQWSPDGAFIAVYTNDGWMIYRVECVLAGGECEPTLLSPDANDVRIAWGPDGSAIAYRSDPQGRSLSIITRGCWDSLSACLTQQVLASNLAISQPDWSRDGGWLAFITLPINTDIYIMDIACLDRPLGCIQSSQLAAGGLYSELWPSLSADGSALVYAVGAANITDQLFLHSLNSGETRQLTFRNADSTQPDWSADDRYIAYAGFAEDGVGLLDVYVMDLPRGIHVRLVRNPDRDMFPNWGPLPQ